MKKYTQDDVDNWVKANGEYCADGLLDEMLPKHRQKLNRLDKRIVKLLDEIKEVFPDACYYTASGGFNLILGETHSGSGEQSQTQRSAWGGSAIIGDVDW